MAKTQSVQAKESNLPVQVKEPNLPSQIQQANISNLPAYLQKRMLENPNKAPVGTENLKRYWQPDRVKIVQAQSGEKFKQFPVGTVVLLPQLSKIADPGMPFWITPILQYSEFYIWNPYKLKGTLPTIRERTFDPDSIIAKRARSKDQNNWYEICPDLPTNMQGQKNDRNYMLRYCEHIQYLSVLAPNFQQPEHPANKHANVPILLSFHHSGYWEGSTLSTLIVNRNADIFSCRFELSTGDKVNSQGNWKGFNINNPSLDCGIEPFVQEEEMYLNYEKLFKSLQSRFSAGEIFSGDYSEDISDSEPAASSGIDDGKM